MPNAANKPAPASEPAIRAESDVVRDTPMVAISRSAGIVSGDEGVPNRLVRTAGISPDRVVTANTCSGCSSPEKASSVTPVASTA